MKTRITIIALFLFALNSFSQIKSKEQKIISYNIWNGYDFGKDEERRGKLVNWMKSESPTIVGLQELVRYTPEKLEEDAKNWGHEHSVLLKEKGYSVGLTSQYPIEVIEEIFDGMHHGALHCKTGGLDVFVIHFSPFSYVKRMSEAKIVLERVRQVAKTTSNYIVMGDFNAHSPMDADLFKNDVLVERMRSNKKNQGEQGNLNHGKIDYTVISEFLANSLVDVCQEFTESMDDRGSFPGRPLGEKNEESIQDLVSRLERIDFIFVSPQLGNNLIDAEVFNKEPNWYLSDHYPVGVTLKVQ